MSRTGLLSSLPKRFALMQLKILSKVTVVTENENQYYRLCEEKTLVVDEKPNPVSAQFSEETFARAVSEDFTAFEYARFIFLRIPFVLDNILNIVLCFICLLTVSLFVFMLFSDKENVRVVVLLSVVSVIALSFYAVMKRDVEKFKNYKLYSEASLESDVINLRNELDKLKTENKELKNVNERLNIALEAAEAVDYPDKKGAILDQVLAHMVRNKNEKSNISTLEDVFDSIEISSRNIKNYVARVNEVIADGNVRGTFSEKKQLFNENLNIKGLGRSTVKKRIYADVKDIREELGFLPKITHLYRGKSKEDQDILKKDLLKMLLKDPEVRDAYYEKYKEDLPYRS